MSAINDVRQRSLKKLADAHDYFTFTKRAWQAWESMDELGQSVSLRNLTTGTIVSGSELLVRSKGYVANELTAATLQQFVSIFEHFLFDVMKLWLAAHPKSLSGRQVSGREVFAAADKAAIVDALVEKELRDVFYDRPANWFEYLRSRTGVAIPADDVERFAEVKATRDVLVHGGGIASPFYVDKAGRLARAIAGQPLDLPEPYHHASWALMCKMVDDVGTGMARSSET